MKHLFRFFYTYKITAFVFFLFTPTNINAQLVDLDYPIDTPTIISDNNDFDQLYKLAIETVQKNIVNNEQEEPIITAGDLWQELWTRDIAYSGLFSLNLLIPDLIKQNYDYRLFENYDIIQDPSAEIGDWPTQTDKVVLLVAWYDWLLINWNNENVEEFIKIANQTLISTKDTIWDNSTGLFTGIPSIIDSFSAFPIEYQDEKKDQFIHFKSLSTNLLYWKAFDNNCQLLKQLEQSLETNSLLSQITQFNYCQFAGHLKRNINNYFWQTDLNYYGTFLNENNQLNTGFDSLGNSLALYWDFLDDQKIETFTKNLPWQQHGLPFRYPYYQLGENWGDKPWYQNSTIWPVTSHLMHSAFLKKGINFVFDQKFFQSTTITLAEKDFNELYDATWGYKLGSSNQLWSATAFLGIFYQGILGLEFNPAEISFTPCLPDSIPNLKIGNFPLTNDLNLKIEFKGTGCTLQSAILVSNLQGEQTTGIELETASFPKDLTGDYKLIFVMQKDDKTTQFLNHQQKQILSSGLKENIFQSNQESLQKLDQQFFYKVFFQNKYSLPLKNKNYSLADFNLSRNLFEAKLNFTNNQNNLTRNLLFETNQRHYTHSRIQKKDLFFFNNEDFSDSLNGNTQLRKIDFIQMLNKTKVKQ